MAVAGSQKSRRDPSLRATLSLGMLAALALVIGYAASPYVALWELGRALASNDIRSLREGIDWSDVRAGLKLEIEAGLADTRPAAAFVPSGSAAAPSPGTIRAVREAAAIVPSRPAAPAAEDDLPDFGDSFASSAIGRSVDQDCTPERLAGMLGPLRAHASLLAQARRAIGWAFFVSPRRFEAFLRPNDSALPVRVTMAFSRRHGWTVTRVWLPPEMLDPRAQERT